MEQARLFQRNRFHCADFRDWNRDWSFQNEHCSFWKNSDWNQKINHRTNTAIFYVTGSTVQKIGRAAQADCFREVGGAYIMSRSCCAWRNNQYIVAAETIITTQHVQQLHLHIRHRHLRPLFSSSKQNIRSVTWILGLHHCQSRNMWPRLMNINFQSRFSAQWNTHFSCKDVAGQSWAMVSRWRFFDDFWVLHFQRASCSTFQTCILNSQGPHHV